MAKEASAKTSVDSIAILNRSKLADHIPIEHPWLMRFCPSAILYHDNGPSGSNFIHTADKEIYGGDASHPILFRIGNGGAGYTGVLKVLAERYIEMHGNDYRIAWVSNHSRHTQAALLADIVQVALTYEPHNEDLAISEGWCRRVCRAFNDHFILVGPKANPAGLRLGESITNALRSIASCAGSDDTSTIFHTRGDGSATFYREQRLWGEAHVGTSEALWLHTHALPPYQALIAAEAGAAYLLTDRATYLTANKDGVIPNLRVYVEGGGELLNPCSALINVKALHDRAHVTAWHFAEWLGGHEAQATVKLYGKEWKTEMALFTIAEQDDFDANESLVGLNT